MAPEVLDEYLGGSTIVGQPIDIAFRSFLEFVVLPREASLIDTLANQFSRAWYEANKDGQPPEVLMGLTSAEAAYVLIFSILMLNTDLHRIPPQSRRPGPPVCMADFVRICHYRWPDLIAVEYLEAIYRRLEAKALVEGPID